MPIWPWLAPVVMMTASVVRARNPVHRLPSRRKLVSLDGLIVTSVTAGIITCVHSWAAVQQHTSFALAASDVIYVTLKNCLTADMCF